MKTLPPPGLGDNFFVICWNCGEISYAHKGTARFCQNTQEGKRATCNPAYHSRGKRPCYDPTVTTCFGERVNSDEVIARFFAYYEKGEGQWSLPIPERMLFRFGEYHGPLPQGTETVIVGGYALRKVRREIIGDVAYLIKPFIYLGADEREVRRNLVVRGLVNTFYPRWEEHPLAAVDLSDSEAEIQINDIVFWCDQQEAIQFAWQQKSSYNVLV